MSEFQSFQELLDFFTQNYQIKICVQDVVGVFHNDILKVRYENLKNSSKICDYSKTSPKGFRLCTACKLLSNNKGITTKKPFVGFCPMGLTTIVIPVIKCERVICILYIGNIIIDPEHSFNRMARTAKRTGANINTLKKLMEESQQTNQLDFYMDLAKILKSYVLLLYERTYPLLKDNSHSLVESIQFYIREYYDKELSVSHIAKIYYLSEKHIGRIFRTKTGKTIIEYLNEIRIGHAKNILTFTNNSILSAALLVGYKNVSYFNKIFKKITGSTPSEYRLQLKNPKTG